MAASQVGHYDIINLHELPARVVRDKVSDQRLKVLLVLCAGADGLKVAGGPFTLKLQVIGHKGVDPEEELS